MKYLKTENCVICGSKAIGWHGDVLAKEKIALGNYIDVKVVSGYCEEHLHGGAVAQGEPYNN